MESKCIPQFLITQSVKYVPLYNKPVGNTRYEVHRTLHFVTCI